MNIIMPDSLSGYHIDRRIVKGGGRVFFVWKLDENGKRDANDSMVAHASIRVEERDNEDSGKDSILCGRIEWTKKPGSPVDRAEDWQPIFVIQGHPEARRKKHAEARMERMERLLLERMKEELRPTMDGVELTILRELRKMEKAGIKLNPENKATLDRLESYAST